MCVPTDTQFQSFGDNIQRHTLNNVSMDKIVQQDTFLSWFSQVNIPADAFILVAEEILDCAYDMVYDDKYKNIKVLTIHVDFVVTRPTGDDCEDEENPSFDEDEEVVIEVEEEDNRLVHYVARAIEGEADEDYYYEVDHGLEEEIMAEEEHNWFTPAAKLRVEETQVNKMCNFWQVALCPTVPCQSSASAAEHRGKVDVH
ncbi:RING-type E3 ubiquitin transferase [Trifolium repens]|nr:RING-type E3 ubiquitin transferase [Trifolium repens]